MSKMILGLAPMDGYTDCAFRQIVKEVFDKYGEISPTKNNKLKTIDLYMRTEFMNADGYVINPIGVAKHLLTDKNQKHVTLQIFGSNEKMLVKCFKDIEKKYFCNLGFSFQNSKKDKKNHDNSALCAPYSEFSFAGIELNMGCPAKKVMNTGGGSALMKDKKKSLDLIKKLRKSVKVPLSIKTRIGLDEKDIKQQLEFLIEASNYVDMISVHGRTTKQVYSGDVDWEFIYELKRQVQEIRNNAHVLGTKSHITKCKIIGNGGIRSYDDIKNVIGNLDGVMIGQAAIGNPRIFTPHTPSKKELKETILKHLNYMVAYEQFFQKQKEKFNGVLAMPNNPKIASKDVPQIVVIEFRKHLFQYLKGIQGSKELKQKLSSIVEYKPLVDAIHKFFG